MKCVEVYIQNKCLVVLLFFALLCALYLILPCTVVASADYEPVYTEHKSPESAEYLWNELSKHSPSDAVTAGVLGMFWRESFLQSDVVAGAHLRGETVSEDFTAKIDAGLHDGSTREEFIHSAHHRFGGYGLCQWIGDYLGDFYDFIREREGSIGDAALQCEFTIQSMKECEGLWEFIVDNPDPMSVARRIGSLYDGATFEGIEVIAWAAKGYYAAFATEEKE